MPGTISAAGLNKPQKAYTTKKGSMWHSKIEDYLDSAEARKLAGKVDLIFTSPPYILIRKKKYGNKDGEAYLNWLKTLAPKLAGLLSPTGSIVIELGNAWEEGRAEMSTLPLKSLIAFQEAAELLLCQHIIWHNPARLPSPAVWVTIERIRLKDSFTHVWWMSKTSKPKADNKRVLVPYSESMRQLLKSQKYNAGKRPSGHHVSEKAFLTDHGGAIASSVVGIKQGVDRFPESLLQLTNTKWDIEYGKYCKEMGLASHPARMPMDLAGFMIQFLTEPGDLVMDPFAGSNTTGAAAESLGRKWVGVEANADYIEGSKARFGDQVKSSDLTRAAA